MKMSYRTCTVSIYDSSRLLSVLKLDSRKYDVIGFTDEELDEYMKKHILKKGEWYSKDKDKIFGIGS